MQKLEELNVHIQMVDQGKDTEAASLNGKKQKKKLQFK